MHVDGVFKWSLWKSLLIINLATLEFKSGSKYHDKADGAPLHNWRIGIPLVNAMALLASVRTNSTFVFQEGAIRSMFATV